MIYSISIENFFSIADCQKLNFKIGENAPDLPGFKVSLSDGLTRLPTAVGFFGPNASGKSTILRAIIAAMVFACNSVDWAGNVINDLFQPYRRDDWIGKPTKICIEFDGRLHEKALSSKFRYELSIAHVPNNFSNKTVIYEALFYAPKNKYHCLFKRDGQNFSFGKEFRITDNDPRIKENIISSNMSTISALAKFNHSLSIFLSHQLRNVQTNIIGSLKIQNNATQILSIYAQNPLCLERLNRELRRIDIGLETMHIEQTNTGPLAKFKHAGLDGFILLPEESNGTQRFIEIFPRLHYALEIGSIAIIDEIDTDLHPTLIPELLRWFDDPKHNPHGAQLFFTAHNPVLLDELEKEQIFFTTKQSGQPTQVYGAVDIKGLRREPSLMKKYLNGELGAIPHIG
ncbi:MAG: AAA family ATPase [Gammaproteobacteria bacterium]